MALFFIYQSFHKTQSDLQPGVIEQRPEFK